MIHRVLSFVLVAVLLATPGVALAQFSAPSTSVEGPAREVAPFDPTGYWVSIVTEDWRFRMATPPKGDFPGVPLTPEGRKIAMSWNPEKDTRPDVACQYYGMPALMRIPTRIHITWADENTLKIETDNGMQTRTLHFGEAEPPAEASRQGFSKAEWVVHRHRGQVESGTIKVTTTHLAPGYLRWNGVPYSDETTVTEYIDFITHPNGDNYLIFKTLVKDPEYLTETFITSTNFRKQPDDSGWDPKECWVPEPPDVDEAMGYR